MATKKNDSPKEEVKAEVKAKEEVIEQPVEQTTAKAGKRSAKAIKEVEEKEAKEQRKTTKAETEKPKVKQNPPRTRLERRSKGYKNSYSVLEKGKVYPINEAVEVLKKTSSVKFDATVEVHVNLNVDPTQADQNVRDSLVLPAGSGKKIRVAVFTDDAKAAKDAGADLVGSDDLLAQIDKGKLDFDLLITSPAQMPKLAKYARILGPRGLMPSPRNGSVTADIAKAIKESKGGRIEYRVDANSIVHLGVGKVSFTNDQLKDNITAFISNLRSNKPSSVKGAFIDSVFLTTTMGPSILLDIGSLA